MDLASLILERCCVPLERELLRECDFLRILISSVYVGTEQPLELRIYILDL